MSKDLVRLDAIVREKHQVSWSKARDWIESRKIWLNGKPVTDPATKLPSDAPIELKMNTPRESAARREAKSATLAPDQIVFVDSQVIVVNKPSNLSTVPFEKDELDSLEQRACRHLGQPKLHVVHRIDKETSGLVVFARTAEAAQHLGNQFRFHTVLRRYLALAYGDVSTRTFRSFLAENRGDGLRGSIHALKSGGRDVSEAKKAITHVSALARLEDSTLIECKLETGRTHQIRIHLSEAGHPLLGEKLYIRGFAQEVLEIVARAPRIMLHAAELGFEHPTKNIPMRWTAMPPADFMGLLDRETNELIKQAIAKDPT